MGVFYDRLNGRIKKIDEKVAELNNLRPVDELHKKEIAEARKKLTDRYNETIADKQAGADYKTAYDEAIQAKLKADQAQQLSEQWNQYHENLKQSLNQKYPGSYLPPPTNVINKSLLPPSELAAYENSRHSRDKALRYNQARQEELTKALAKQNEALTKYYAVVKKIDNTFPANNDLTDPCIPCKAIERQKKFERVKAAFVGQQSFGNCGIQSSNQVLELVDCAEKDEAALLKKSLKNGNAKLVEKPPKTPDEQLADILDPASAAAAKNQKIDDIKPIRNGNGVISSSSIGQNRSRPVDSIAKNHNETIIDIDQTGGTSPEERQKIMKGEGTESSLDDPTPENIGKALKGDKVMIFSTDVSRLGPAEDENGRPVDAWFYTADYTDPAGVVHRAGTPKQAGGHAITVADGKFDEDGKLTHVLISDTGQGKMYYMKIDAFKNSLRPNRKMNVSKEPMKMKCP